MARRAKRLRKAFEDMLKNPVDGIRVFLPDDNDISVWHASITGPPNTPYEGGTYLVKLKFSRDYPNRPPVTTMKTKIYHININRAGKFCTALLDGEWTRDCTVGDILEEIYEYLVEPVADMAIVLDALELYVENRDKYIEIAKKWNAKFAKKPEHHDDNQEQTLANSLQQSVTVGTQNKSKKDIIYVLFFVCVLNCPCEQTKDESKSNDEKNEQLNLHTSSDTNSNNSALVKSVDERNTLTSPNYNPTSPTYSPVTPKTTDSNVNPKTIANPSPPSPYYSPSNSTYSSTSGSPQLPPAVSLVPIYLFCAIFFCVCCV